MKKLNYRQVHLDFHTSPAIPGIGSRFSKEQFAKALRLGHVDSITLFSKCHHGYAYHPSDANIMHPGLDFDLLKEQLDVCKEVGVNAPVYLSAGLDEKEASVHPEWLNVPSPGAGPDFVNRAYYKLFCYNTPYLDKLAAQVEEVMIRYNPVGIFLDISAERTCYCTSCIASMREKGLDPKNPEDVKKHGKDVYAAYCRRMEEVIHKHNPEATIFHNAGNIDRGRRDVADFDTHFELESLPTGGWGYDHFPMSAAYVKNLGKEYLGMTGKFHTSWGEFGGFKHPNALRYEAALSISLGAKCSIGDQLHPTGEMNLATYGLIGKAYAEVEKKEEWCRDAKGIADIAILSAVAVNGKTQQYELADRGASRMLLEGKYLFDIIDLDTSFDGYKLVVIPDCVKTDCDLARRIEKYVSDGGKILVSGSSCLDRKNGDFAVELGVSYDGECEYKPTYMVPAEQTEMINGITSYVMYSDSLKITPKSGSEVFAYRADPYFNRTPEHFSSHKHTPDKPDDRHTGAVYNGNTAYIAWNIFGEYATIGSLCLKELVHNAIERLIGNEKTVTVSGIPDRGVVTLTSQAEKDRLVAHMLFAHTCIRGEKTEVIEDTVPLYNIKMEIKSERKPASVRIVPESKPIDFVYDNGKIFFTVPEMEIHAMVEIAY